MRGGQPRAMLAPAPEAELPRRAESAALNSNRPSALRADVTSEASVPTPPFYPALRRRKLRIAHFRRKRRKIACSAAPPFPTAPALLGCGGSPDCPRRMWENRPQRVQRGLSGQGWAPVGSGLKAPHAGAQAAYRGSSFSSSSSAISRAEALSGLLSRRGRLLLAFGTLTPPDERACALKWSTAMRGFSR